MTDREFNLNKLTENLEELSLKKQLPLRSQAQKPVLKYNTHVSKPISLVSPPYFFSKLVTQNRGIPKHGTPHRSSAVRVREDSSRMDSRPPRHAAGLGSGASTQSTGCIPQQKATKNHSNPYTRPLSAKEVADDIKCYRQVLKNASNNLSSSMEKSMGTTPNGILQLNSFMRPQSAAFNESTVKPKSPRKVKLKSLSDSGAGAYPENGNRSKNNHFKPGHVDKKPSVDPLFTKPPLSTCISQTKSLALLSFNTSVAEQRTKIRNLNYTPSRPYSEVSEPNSDSTQCSASSTCSSNRSSPGFTSHTQVFSPILSSPSPVRSLPLSEVNCKSSQNLTAMTTLNSDLVSVTGFQKMPVTNTITGTIYYKKGSKPAEELHETRPMADGAPSKLYEKADSSDDEDTDEESEDNDSAFPSG